LCDRCPHFFLSHVFDASSLLAFDSFKIALQIAFIPAFSNHSCPPGLAAAAQRATFNSGLTMATTILAATTNLAAPFIVSL
jgi:hypothetical protein